MSLDFQTMYWDHIFQVVLETQWAGWQKCSHVAWRCFSSISLFLCPSLLNLTLPKVVEASLKNILRQYKFLKGKFIRKRGTQWCLKMLMICVMTWSDFLRSVSNDFYLCLLWNVNSVMDSSIIYIVCTSKIL